MTTVDPTPDRPSDDIPELPLDEQPDPDFTVGAPSGPGAAAQQGVIPPLPDDALVANGHDDDRDGDDSGRDTRVE